MAFEFRLEKVLSIRRSEEDEASRKFALAKARLTKAREALLALEEAQDENESSLEAKKRADKLDGEYIHRHALRHAGLTHDIDLARNEIVAANHEARKANEALTEAHRAVEVLEKLRERDLEAFRKDQLRREAVQMDEVAVSRHRLKEVSK